MFPCTSSHHRRLFPFTESPHLSKHTLSCRMAGALPSIQPHTCVVLCEEALRVTWRQCCVWSAAEITGLNAPGLTFHSFQLQIFSRLRGLLLLRVGEILKANVAPSHSPKIKVCLRRFFCAPLPSLPLLSRPPQQSAAPGIVLLIYRWTFSLRLQWQVCAVMGVTFD